MKASSVDHGLVVFVHCGGKKAAGGQHEIDTQRALAVQIARLLDAPFCGEFDAARRHPHPYLIPDDTLSLDDAARMGIAREDDFFGGVVPYPFVATKVIAHGLPPGARAKPAGWPDALGERISDLVLPGYSAFSRDDAHAAAALLWKDGAVRLKRPSGIGGSGQAVIADESELAAQLDDIGDATLRAEGVVLERDLRDIATFSVGHVRVRAHEASYFGVQHLTRNNHGHSVYGGSDLVVVRGGFDALEGIDMPDDARMAIGRARAFDAAIHDAFPDFFASRRNYDAACGAAGNGDHVCGVLEQSWRIGGASGAEIGALRVFANDPALRLVRASTVEAYGDDVDVPAHACIDYRGTDPRTGPLTKFHTVDTTAEGASA
ncbi:hypothetical protein BSFA1_70860 (plasmid) [Burkholderia sp. SFA1]|uniref:DUF3182 family protein n=1 Tax=unclassified Caballeronia TaxID=2646786 RepID=UPI001F43BF16|nr:MULTISPECIES: DUF3182 family protein [unclassified Caballeronia]MCE4546859.1 DUF3182 family protein [Caballeronia sp. PC1]MCE4572668.1 DUF3182 family protein [Caballeronia sp. CLC5]BBQ01958.1 hypothetical protein BSFA1_70860 [Burkholderia sp. SFA1]